MYCFYVVTCDDDEDAQSEFSKMSLRWGLFLIHNWKPPQGSVGICGHLSKQYFFFLANTNREQAEPPLQLQIHVLTFKA